MKKIIITFVALIIGLICRAQTIDEHYYFTLIPQHYYKIFFLST